MLPEHFHLFGERPQVEEDQRDDQRQGKIEIIEREDPQKTPSIELDEERPARQGAFHIHKDACDKKSRQDEEQLNPHPPKIYVIGVNKEDQKKCNAAQTVQARYHQCVPFQKEWLDFKPKTTFLQKERGLVYSRNRRLTV
jgi:hypothetical protein